MEYLVKHLYFTVHITYDKRTKTLEVHMENQRIDMRVPLKLLKQVEEYQKDQGISSRTAAFLELVRKGLNNG